MILEDKYLGNNKWVCMLAIALVILSLGNTVVCAADESQLSESVQVDEVDIMATWDIDWDMRPYEKAYGKNRFTLVKGDKISFNLSWFPQPGTVSVGLYNHDTNDYHWAVSSVKSPFKSKIVAPEKGLYSFAIRNRTSDPIHVSGYYKH